MKQSVPFKTGCHILFLKQMWQIRDSEKTGVSPLLHTFIHRDSRKEFGLFRHNILFLSLIPEDTEPECCRSKKWDTPKKRIPQKDIRPETEQASAFCSPLCGLCVFV